jgi:serine/threonine protein kinase
MDYCPLGSLEHYLKPEMKPPVFEWTLQLCDALAYLHGLDCAHNQLYPCNVLVAGGGSELQICDFGTVTRANEHDFGSYPTAPELAITQQQTSADWQNPKGHLCDVYSLGLLTWFMQHGGKETPHNYVWQDGSLVAIHSHLDMLNVTGLQLDNFMRTCWAHHKSRPTSGVLLERLRAMQ